MRVYTEEQKKQRRLREQRKREFERRAGHIICEVWERSGIGAKTMQGGMWHVTHDAITSAVKFTYSDGVNEVTWLEDALRIFKLAMTPSPGDEWWDKQFKQIRKQ